MKRFVLLGLAVLAAGILAWLGLEALARQRLASNEKAAARALKRISSAQADFRANDRDGNAVNDFWTGDVAHLYYLVPASEEGAPGGPLKLIEKAVADADPASHGDVVADPAPYAGYWFRAMDADDSFPPAREYRVDTDGKGGEVHHTSKYGFCAYPQEYGGTGRATYIVNESNTVYKIDNGGRPVLRWPQASELKDLHSHPRD